MYENMTVLTNQEYSELIIKAHKYDMLRKRALESEIYIPDGEVMIYEFTEDEINTIKERRKF